MKKVAVTVAVLALGLAACGAKTDDAVENDTNVENAAEAALAILRSQQAGANGGSQ